MSMQTKSFLLLFSLLLTLPQSALAGEYEVTPIYGYSVGGQFASADKQDTYDLSEEANYGLILGIRDHSQTEAFYELLYSHQKTSLEGDGTVFDGDSRFDVDISYLHLGGRYGTTGEPVNPYLAGGIGATHFDPERGEAETRFSFSLGAGLMLPLGEHAALRLEGRGFGTLFNSRGEIFCVDGNCSVRIDSDLFWQFSGFAGLAISF